MKPTKFTLQNTELLEAAKKLLEASAAAPFLPSMKFLEALCDLKIAIENTERRKVA